jgi:hypothetical protein
MTTAAHFACAVAAGLLLPTIAMKAPPQRRSLHASDKMPYLNHQDLHEMMNKGQQVDYDPDEMRDQWISVNEDVEFLPSLALNPNQRNANDRLMQRTLEEFQASTSGAYTTNPYSVQPFIEGLNNYDEYSQAWRMLGFMVDCNEVMYDDDNAQSHGGSRDGQVTEEGCARYVIWAAYVDTEYEGGGIGEYMYWNREENKWDDSACYVGGGGNKDGDDGYKTRCAKMDCHLENTHFSVLGKINFHSGTSLMSNIFIVNCVSTYHLMRLIFNSHYVGFFKHRNYDDWMEQLFKHEGMCVWTDEEYAFMKNARKSWPRGCTATGTTIPTGDEDGTEIALYYNIRPLRSGRISVGLYTDTQCVLEYPADTSTVEGVVGNIFSKQNSHDSGDGNYDFSSDSLSDSLNRWNSAFDVWRMCHPCVAYDLENVNGTKYTDDDDDDYYNRNYNYNNYWWYYGNRDKERKLGGEYNAKGDTFECYDDGERYLHYFSA